MAQENPKNSQQKNSKKKRRRNSKQKKSKNTPSILDPVSKGPKKKRPLTEYDPIEVLTVEEPSPLCTICSKPIKAIAQALSGPGEDEYAHFDCVLEKIREDEKPTEKQKISYIGRGTFAIIDTDDEGNMVFIKRIVWETAEKFDAMKKFVEGNKK